MSHPNVLVAEGNYLIREGLVRCLETQGVQVWSCVPEDELIDQLLEDNAIDVIILDYFSKQRNATQAYALINRLKKWPILGIVEDLETSIIKGGLESGLAGHVLKDCDGEEIFDAVRALKVGESFFCGQIVDALNDESTHLGCDGVQLSEREVEVIALIAEGMTNKEIADKLFLSNHTVTTHRKNIMSKLGVNNTAGIVLFAVKSNFISPNRFLFAGSQS